MTLAPSWGLTLYNNRHCCILVVVFLMYLAAFVFLSRNNLLHGTPMRCMHDRNSCMVVEWWVAGHKGSACISIGLAWSLKQGLLRNRVSQASLPNHALVNRLVPGRRKHNNGPKE